LLACFDGVQRRLDIHEQMRAFSGRTERARAAAVDQPDARTILQRR
jgi:hypothetical protein